MRLVGTGLASQSPLCAGWDDNFVCSLAFCILEGFFKANSGVDFGLGGKCSSRVSKRLHDSFLRKTNMGF